MSPIAAAASDAPVVHRRRLRSAVFVLMAAALLLHGTTFMLADHGNLRFLLELLGASLAPYVIVGGTALLSPWITWLWPALALMLAADVAAFLSGWPQETDFYVR